MKKNLKIFGVGTVLPTLVISLLLYGGATVLATVVLAMVLVGQGIVHCIREDSLELFVIESKARIKTIEGLEYSLRSLRAKYGRLKSDIREMVK